MYLSECGDSQSTPDTLKKFVFPAPSQQCFDVDDPPEGTIILEKNGILAEDAKLRWYLVSMGVQIFCDSTDCDSGTFKISTGQLAGYLRPYVRESGSHPEYCRAGSDSLFILFVAGDGGSSPVYIPSSCGNCFCDCSAEFVGAPQTEWPGNHPPAGIICGNSGPISGNYIVSDGTLKVELLCGEECE